MLTLVMYPQEKGKVSQAKEDRQRKQTKAYEGFNMQK
jgi:hypothetical protein